MTSHKLCLTALVLVVVSVTVDSHYDPSNHRRARRANAKDERPTEAPSFSSDELQEGYRFGDEYFLPEASKAIPTEYKKADGCERVVKDSMVCMVCKEPETNAKYEQCSYVAQPKDKAFTYAKSRAFGNPEKTKESTSANEDSDGPESSGEAYESSEPAPYKSYETSEPTETGYGNGDGYRAPSRYSAASGEESENYGDPAESSDCRRVVKNGKTCTICRDPKTGSDVERCSSNYGQPVDEYTSVRSEKFGYPESQEDREEYNSGIQDSKNFESSEDPAETSNCRQVSKDGQTCSVCRDPKTGSDLERCSSSYRPDDKAYVYGKSERYGFPHSDEDNKNYEARDDEDKSAEASESPSYESSPSEFQAGYLKSNEDNYRRYYEDEPEEFSEYKSERASSPEHGAPTVVGETKQPRNTGGDTNCREVKKDSMTCTVCTDPKTGGNFQKCSYAYEPSDKVYKFSKSKNFGYPETLKASENGGDESETKQVPKAVKASRCRQVRRDSKTCEICEDPVTGESSEQCKYSYKPKEKHFAFRNSKSSGNQRNDGKNERDGGTTEDGPQESRQVPRWTDEGKKKNARSEEKADAATASPCRQIIKDSMTCTICKDPKSGAQSEQCAYSSEPKEKMFTYSRSKTVGRPRKTGAKRDDRSREGGTEESRKSQFVVEPEKGVASEGVAASTAANPCRQVAKDSMTCTICKDPETGENSEQCAYSSQPKKRHFTYSKSQSFGSPRKSEEELQESQLAPRSSGDEWRHSAKRSRGISKSDRGSGL